MLPGWQFTLIQGTALAQLNVSPGPALWFYVFPWASLHLPIDSSGFNG